MKENTFKTADVKVYTKTLSNGLEVIMIPDNRKKLVKAQFVTNFGGKDLAFKTAGEKQYTKVPVGIAHFLEHKMFESKARDIDVYTFFDQAGANANAYTNKDLTAYYFETNTNFEKCLEFLLDFVQSPNITDENVEKEKGIIGQEIEMGDDDFGTFMTDLTLNNLFFEDTIKYSIDGTCEDISTITKELLMKCYDTFYHPKNMFLVVTGNFNPTKALKLIEENQKKKKFPAFKKIERKVYHEKDEVLKKEEKVKFNVKNPKVSIVYKIPLKKIDMDKRKISEYIDLILNMNFSRTSIYREELEEQKIVEAFDCSSFATDSHLLIAFRADTKNPKKFLDSIKKKMTNLEVDNNLLEIKKRSVIASYVSMFDNPSSVADYITTIKNRYLKLDYNEIDLIKEAKLKDIQNLITKLSFSNYNITILEPKK